MTADLIAAFRTQLAERERQACEALREPGHLYDSPAAGQFLTEVPFQVLLGVVAARNLLDLLEAAHRRRDAVQARAAWTEITAPAFPDPLPDGPGEEMLPGLELAVRTLATQFDDPVPAVRQMLEAITDAWERGDPAPAFNIRALVNHAWCGFEAHADIAPAPGLTPEQLLSRPHGGLKIAFHATLFNGVTVSTSERVVS
ncbi:hypothetical protein [Streptosporangium sp. NPDC051022]|uniref:hypothetical protein n=1 Tax=Streptosporangium sp. NPDC051022 TaxID=3155752 RepID=UPI0034489AE2